MTRLSEGAEGGLAEGDVAAKNVTADGVSEAGVRVEGGTIEDVAAGGVTAEVLLDGVKFPGQMIAAVCMAVEATLTFRVLEGTNQTMVTARQDVPMTRDIDGAAALTAEFLRGQLKRFGFLPVDRF